MSDTGICPSDGKACTGKVCVEGYPNADFTRFARVTMICPRYRTIQSHSHVADVINEASVHGIFSMLNSMRLRNEP